MDNQISVRVAFKKNVLENKTKSILDTDTMTDIQRLFAETIDPWTPFLTGRLAGDLTINSDGVTYNVPYAAEKYYGTVFHKEVHPLATSHWDEVAMDTEMESFELKVKDIISRRLDELYG